MARIIITEYVSLDGVMQAPGGGEDFQHAGWTFTFDRGDAGNQFKLRETIDSEALLLGRVTYEGFAAAWPNMEGEFADKFNSMPKYVISKTLMTAGWNNSTILSGNVVEEVSKLKQAFKGDIVVHGSAQLVRTLLENDLVDELRLMVYPIVLGSGKKLFADMPDSKRMQLVDSKTVGAGITIQTYAPDNARPA